MYVYMYLCIMYINTDFIKQFLTSVVRTVHIFMARSRVSKRYLVVEL